MKKPERVVRGPFTFEIRSDEQVHVTLGDPASPESEFVLQVHESYLPDLIAGLSAICKGNRVREG